MKLNTRTEPVRTHEGAVAKRINAKQQLERSLMCCMLWEDSFYENGESIADRIVTAVAAVKPGEAFELAVKAREDMKLRHAPLLVARAMAALPSHRSLVADTLARIIQRPDELAEFLAIYWKDGKKPLAAQVKKGLARAFTKFNEYSLAKYNRDGAIKLRDVLFLCHAKPKDEEQAALWKRLIDGTLQTPDTWEVALSSGGDKKEHWERLIAENKLGALAFLRNLRNMTEAGVPYGTIVSGIRKIKTERVLPFRFIAAARHNVNMEPELESLMLKCMESGEKLVGRTLLLVDVSGSMVATVSGKSEISRLDAACGVGMLLREVCESAAVVTFSDSVVAVPARRGFALRDAIVSSQSHGGTYLGAALQHVQQHVQYDRIIVITDEQSHDKVPDPNCKNAYMVNVACEKNGVGYGPWTHIDGWSESIVGYIQAFEQAMA